MHRVLDFLTLRRPLYRWTFIGIVTTVLYLVPYEFLEKSRLSLFERMGIPSPTIGLTRAYWRLIRGDFVGAWERNKLIYAVIALLFVLLVIDLIHSRRK